MRILPCMQLDQDVWVYDYRNPTWEEKYLDLEYLQNWVISAEYEVRSPQSEALLTYVLPTVFLYTPSGDKYIHHRYGNHITTYGVTEYISRHRSIRWFGSDFSFL